MRTIFFFPSDLKTWLALAHVECMAERRDFSEAECFEKILSQYRGDDCACLFILYEKSVEVFINLCIQLQFFVGGFSILRSVINFVKKCVFSLDQTYLDLMKVKSELFVWALHFQESLQNEKTIE